MTKITSLIVGSHFKPPAKLLLENLPRGTPLSLEPDPENPYDPNAIRVLVGSKDIPESRYETLEGALGAVGVDGMGEILGEASWFLGHVAASEGKPLLKAREATGDDYKGTLEFLLYKQENGAFGSCQLGFNSAGSPTIEMEVLSILPISAGEAAKEIPVDMTEGSHRGDFGGGTTVEPKVHPGRPGEPAIYNKDLSSDGQPRGPSTGPTHQTPDDESTIGLPEDE